MIWVVDSADIHRMLDCRTELHNLLKEEKLAGATLLIFANKQDIGGALAVHQIQQVDYQPNVPTMDSMPECMYPRVAMTSQRHRLWVACCKSFHLYLQQPPHFALYFALQLLSLLASCSNQQQ